MKIITKQVLAKTEDTRITKIDVEAPLIARKAKPGQFIVLIVNEKGERIPLTIVDRDENTGTITLIFQELGLTTKLLGKLNAGDSLYALTGPLGHRTEIRKYGKVILVGGGAGIAEIYPVAKAFKEAGNHVTTIIGSRTKDLLVLEKELREVSDGLFVTTDDGSYGKKGFTTDILKELLSGGMSEGRPRNGYNLVYAVGPIPMMKKASSVSREFNVKTLVSLNSLMVDATGMCGSCRARVGGKTRFTCVDGPEFDGNEIDWEELEKRNQIYGNKEKDICKIYNI